jgi:hypothetical protein
MPAWNSAAPSRSRSAGGRDSAAEGPRRGPDPQAGSSPGTGQFPGAGRWRRREPRDLEDVLLVEGLSRQQGRTAPPPLLRPPLTARSFPGGPTSRTPFGAARRVYFGGSLRQSTISTSPFSVSSMPATSSKVPSHPSPGRSGGPCSCRGPCVRLPRPPPAAPPAGTSRSPRRHTQALRPSGRRWPGHSGF